MKVYHSTFSLKICFSNFTLFATILFLHLLLSLKTFQLTNDTNSNLNNSNNHNNIHSLFVIIF